MLSESLSGIATIRANNALDYFQKKFWEVHDAHGACFNASISRSFGLYRRLIPLLHLGRAFFAFIACSRWLGFRMDALMFIFLAIASFAAVIVHQQAWFDIDPGILGLALSMLIQLSGLFQWCVRQSAEVVNQVSLSNNCSVFVAPHPDCFICLLQLVCRCGACDWICPPPFRGSFDK